MLWWRSYRKYSLPYDLFDGVYIDGAAESLMRFLWVKAPTSEELTRLTHTIAQRIAVGPRQGRKVFTLQTLPDCRLDNLFVDTVGKVAFALQAGIGRIRGVAGINQVAGGKIQRVYTTSKVNG